MDRQQSIQGINQRFKRDGLLNRTGNPLGSEAGVGVVEVVIAMGIFFFTAMALVNMMGNGARINGNSFYMTKATNLARHTLDVLMSRDYDHANLDVTTNPHDWSEGTIFQPEQTVHAAFTNDPGFTHTAGVNSVTWDVEDSTVAGSSLDPNIKRIQVTVTWQGQQATSRTLTLEGVRNLLMRTAL